MTGAVILCIHALFFLVFIALYRIGKLQVGLPAFIIAACLPLVGEIYLLLLASMQTRRLEGAKEAELPGLGQTGEIATVVTIDKTWNTDAVPLEDALYVESPVECREAMIQALMGDAEQYLSTFANARSNEDSEVAHYASTVLAEFSKTYEERHRTMKTDLEENPEDTVLLAKSIAFLETYIASGLLQGKMLESVQAEYLHLLEKKHEKAEALADDRKLENMYIDQGQYDKAQLVVEHMETMCSSSQEVWCARLRYLIAIRDHEAVKGMIAKMSADTGFKIPEVRQALAFWEAA